MEKLTFGAVNTAIITGEFDAELDRLTRLGVCGARFVSPGHKGALPRLSQRLAERVHDWGWHVQFYPHGPDIAEYADKLLALPNTIAMLSTALVAVAEPESSPSMECPHSGSCAFL